MAERVQATVTSSQLGKHRVISGTNYDVVMAKAQALYDVWEVQERAQEKTKEAKARLEEVKRILYSPTWSKPVMDWEKLVPQYPIPLPIRPEFVVSPPKPQANEPQLVYLQIPDKPQIQREPTAPIYLKYSPEPTKGGWVSGGTYERAYSIWTIEVKQTEAENQRRYDENVAAIERWNSPQRRIEEEQAIAKWSEACKQIDDENQRRMNEHPAVVDCWKREHEQAVAEWHKANQQAAAENIRLQNEHTAALERWKAGRIEYEKKEVARLKAESLLPNMVTQRCERVLLLSKLPVNLQTKLSREGKLNFEYVPGTKILIVDYMLPAPQDLPRVKEVKYIKSRNEEVEVYLSDKEFSQIYDDVLYRLCLRTLYELFETDEANALSAVVFNGWVESVDKATGKDTKACVMSVHAKKEEFQKINLARVDPKACFKALKGIGSSTLHSLTPIAPVLKINREDKRFVASYAVAGQLDERTNLAAMDWEDFEHLIRELFEKEFSKPGCEVRVTQASRDGGVDSVVLDSDPIHGGKTVIQAKRYTNTVGVAAVRELYGTVHNEGAMKGILVTTADYGPDAYEFAKGKPLVLLNGANLLHLLEKHGHKAKIDIQEAKRIVAEKES